MLSENVLSRADRSNGEEDLCPSLTLGQSPADPTFVLLNVLRR